MDLNIIIGLLSGSLATLLIKEVFNQINRKVDFSRDLKKLTFERKLDKAEKAVSFYSTYLNTIIEMKKSYEVILKTLNEDKDLDISIVENIINQHSNNLTKLMKNSYPEANTAHLYFDLEDLEKWNESDISDLLENLSETKFKDNDIQFWLDIYNSHLEKGEKEKADFYWDKIEESLPSYSKSLQKVVDSLERNRNAVYQLIKTVKEQI
ncbi:hypothetical protein [Algoriphagus formosus]|uniref:Uncharacterized protein n=1 Tax=Algoriphagus formosus TaxID=2007308 RepID=A0A4R5US94_9BACT|nr:hypothetical protein [Algoriphagus aquimaris]TDK41826.1 hypothetical protein E1898_17770 [Algoriphagus aquimaris]